jgi:large subunit ribosomal protein L4
MAQTTAKLDPKIFNAEIKNHSLVGQAYESYLANGRKNLATTKTRGLVRGGGKKPWRQKGTGRARFGSSRNPIWRGGGIVFGPSGNENYSKALNTKAKKAAIRQALTLANGASKISIVDMPEFKTVKTSQFVSFLTKQKADGNVLIAVSELSDNLRLSSRNIPTVKIIRADRLNVYDILNADQIFISSEGMKLIEAWLGDKK